MVKFCVLVAVAIQEKVAWYLQIWSRCFYLMSKSWPLGLLLFLEQWNKHAYVYSNHIYPYSWDRQVWVHSVDPDQMHFIIPLSLITKTRLFKYTENLTTKKWKFSDKKLLYFLNFCSKHRLWVLVRTVSTRRYERVPTIYVFEQK